MGIAIGSQALRRAVMRDDETGCPNRGPDLFAVACLLLLASPGRV